MKENWELVFLTLLVSAINVFGFTYMNFRISAKYRIKCVLVFVPGRFTPDML